MRGTKFGTNAILDIYDKKLLFKGAKYPLIITVVIIIGFALFGQITKEIINSVVDLVLSIIPNLLGFVLSGYALLIGFGNIEIIATKKTNETNKDKPTLYQKVSTVFAVGLIMQILLLVFSFVLKLLLKIDFVYFLEYDLLCNVINYLTFFLLTFGLIYVIVMIKDLVINIFNFSQVQHFYINKPKNEN